MSGYIIQEHPGKEECIKEQIHKEYLQTAERLMNSFAEDTLSDEGSYSTENRYLWTDAFAVCNFLELHKNTGKKIYLDQAHLLIKAVHATLGKHRSDDNRSGWISGLPDDEGSNHPTAGGLRIGKKQNERRQEEPYNPQEEWDRDGQYFHYLTKWMHALAAAGKTAGVPEYIRWAAELAAAVHGKFVYTGPSGEKRMYWKMSIDLSRPLVPSMGQHDPIDGCMTYREIDIALKDVNTEKNLYGSEERDLSPEIGEMRTICSIDSWASPDPLGIGGLLFDAFRLGVLLGKGDTRSVSSDLSLLHTLLSDSLTSLLQYSKQFSIMPLSYRLAFRELGLSISLHSIDTFTELIETSRHFEDKRKSLLSRLREIEQFLPLGREIETTWLDPKNRETSLWLEHKHINNVMLATSLAPSQFLSL